ncbi:TetR/AcrR family transcriptional regulator [Paraburkholderia sp. CNPSo 3272]|uniref:TetR/AcrR family transcriptional regulator n=1 Tax=Paraburkholderia sp. CNPSo 3272 TaxID=2940931 RepID=UPI0020B855E3|nr:TetR/AcrR family transcriptional regulator [Paraburkholderia sp. CNPSo 3272]MCP3725024.1 TetR/AcrR family transcriptional regulator [Paraburkholderia sp. CNPSo 3272]
MSIAERKGRQRAERESRIVAAARVIAEREGWDAVTVRRLAEEIEYSQPVLYSHFENRNAIVSAVALEGFQELTVALRGAAQGAAGQENALGDVAKAYLGFAARCPALYEAMFTLPTDLRFGDAETRPELRAGFEALASVVAPFSTDVENVTETFWAALHGLAELERAGRIRPGARIERVMLVVRAVIASRNGSHGSR